MPRLNVHLSAVVNLLRAFLKYLVSQYTHPSGRLVSLSSLFLISEASCVFTCLVGPSLEHIPVSSEGAAACRSQSLILIDSKVTQ